ncbi:hypothetical protein ASD11_10685 [Aeromicrobium sp. Root495]|uniref:Rv3235 family protein n=1 Tax=Aeromicrobium sp. Root495 TaxID=1736550 RepID=UPI0006F21F1C|nr:Rv3235 family protein [Aeromicrobium sp. Root495]KQY59962.1 hypothetical protein ASD11_10685 [Aeromicrobium sp. Root495]RYJ07634.1 MAG: hypothetical protein EON52_00280 [Actinomycetales bacterium]
MRTATALAPRTSFLRHHDISATAAEQVPLPFPGLHPVLPVPVERGLVPPDSLRGPAMRFTQALAEVLSGGRACRQLAPWVAPDVYDQLQRRLLAHARVPTRRTGPITAARVVSLHLLMVDQEAAEVAARMVHRGRSRAIALRLELVTTHRGERRWQCKALEWA